MNNKRCSIHCITQEIPGVPEAVTPGTETKTSIYTFHYITISHDHVLKIALGVGALGNL